MLRLPFISVLAFLCVPTHVFAQPPFEALALAQLRCSEPPNPLPLLENLEALGKIDPTAIDSMDSVSCFPIKGGILIAGLPFHSVCAFEDDPDIRAKRPDLLVRAPGTAPPGLVSFGTNADLEALAEWYSAAVGPKHATRAIESAEDTLDGKNHVTCNAWFAQ